MSRRWLPVSGGFGLLALSLGLLAPVSGRGQEASFSQDEVRFDNGGVELAGTLMTPETPGPHPAVVFLHGSGPATREGARPYAEAFAGLGFASLFFNKRGTGDSGGSWVTSSLEDLAGDALAAVDYLRSRPGVDPERIGFWGVSQAGWVATLAASRSGDIGFMMLISGGGRRPEPRRCTPIGRPSRTPASRKASGPTPRSSWGSTSAT